VFLYSPDTTLASVAILNLEAEGKIGPATAMATLIVLTSILVCGLYALVTRVLLKKPSAGAAPPDCRCRRDDLSEPNFVSIQPPKDMP